MWVERHYLSRYPTAASRTTSNKHFAKGPWDKVHQKVLAQRFWVLILLRCSNGPFLDHSSPTSAASCSFLKLPRFHHISTQQKWIPAVTINPKKLVTSRRVCEKGNDAAFRFGFLKRNSSSRFTKSTKLTKSFIEIFSAEYLNILQKAHKWANFQLLPPRSSQRTTEKPQTSPRLAHHPLQAILAQSDQPARNTSFSWRCLPGGSRMLLASSSDWGLSLRWGSRLEYKCRFVGKSRRRGGPFSWDITDPTEYGRTACIYNGRDKECVSQKSQKVLLGTEFRCQSESPKSFAGRRHCLNGASAGYCAACHRPIAWWWLLSQEQSSTGVRVTLFFQNEQRVAQVVHRNTW